MKTTRRKFFKKAAAAIVAAPAIAVACAQPKVTTCPTAAPWKAEAADWQERVFLGGNQHGKTMAAHQQAIHEMRRGHTVHYITPGGTVKYEPSEGKLRGMSATVIAEDEYFHKVIQNIGRRKSASSSWPT